MFSPFYLSAFVWNLAHGMTTVLVPLYAVELGMSGVAIGSLLSLPVFLQVLFNLLGGAWVDRLGPKNILLGSSCAAIVASVVYAFSVSFAGMLAGQCLLVVSRASFWPANWSLGSRLPGDRNRNLGWLNSTTNAGQIGGIAVAGVLISALGYRAGFWMTGISALAALALTAAIRHRHVRPTEKSPGIVSAYGSLAKIPALYFAMACGYLSVLPFTLCSSFYPVLLVAEGFSEENTGWLLTLRAFGAIFSGIALAKSVRSPTGLGVPLWCCLGIALASVAAAMFGNAWIIGLALFGLGVGSGLASIYFQLLISAVSTAARRGSAMSFGGLGWQVANITTPLIIGWLMDWIDLRTAFYVVGASLVVLAGLLIPLHRWALFNRTMAESR